MRRRPTSRRTSSSMRRGAWATPGRRRVSKLDHARGLAAALAYLMISQRDAVGPRHVRHRVRGDDPAAVGPRAFLGPLQGDGGDAGRRRDAPQRRPPRPGRADQAARAGDRPLRRVRPADDLDTPSDTSATAATRSSSSRRSPPRRKSSRSPARRSSATSNGPTSTLRINPAALRAAYLERFQAYCRDPPRAAARR